MVRKLEAEARKVAEARGEDVASKSSTGGKSSVLPAKRARGRPPQGAREGAGSLSGWANVRAGAGALGERAAERKGGRAGGPSAGAGGTAGCYAWREAAGGCAAGGAGRLAAGGAQRGHEGRAQVANPDELEAARGKRGTKRTAPEAVAVPEGVAEDKGWLRQCAVELRTGLTWRNWVTRATCSRSNFWQRMARCWRT